MVLNIFYMIRLCQNTKYERSHIYSWLRWLIRSLLPKTRIASFTQVSSGDSDCAMNSLDFKYP